MRIEKREQLFFPTDRNNPTDAFLRYFMGDEFATGFLFMSRFS